MGRRWQGQGMGPSLPKSISFALIPKREQNQKIKMFWVWKSSNNPRWRRHMGQGNQGVVCANIRSGNRTRLMFPAGGPCGFLGRGAERAELLCEGLELPSGSRSSSSWADVGVTSFSHSQLLLEWEGEKQLGAALQMFQKEKETQGRSGASLYTGACQAVLVWLPMVRCRISLWKFA